MCLEGDAPKKAKLYLIQIFLSPLLCHKLPQPNMSTSQVTPPLGIDEAAHLREPQFDSPLFESLSKLFQLLQVTGLLRCPRWS